MTKECIKSKWKLPVDKKRLIILVMMGTRIDAHSFSKEVGIGSSSHCLLGRDCNCITGNIFKSLMLVVKYLVMLKVGKRESHD